MKNNTSTDENYKVDTADEIWTKIRPEVDEFCWKIFEVVNTVLRIHTNFGFKNFEENINPSLTDIHKIMQILEYSIDLFHTNSCDYTIDRNLTNVKQMIFCIKNLSNALINEDEVEYLKMISMMRNQAQH